MYECLETKQLFGKNNFFMNFVCGCYQYRSSDFLDVKKLGLVNKFPYVKFL